MKRKIIALGFACILLLTGANTILALNVKVAITDNSETGILTVNLKAGDFSIKDSCIDGFSEIVMDEFGYTSVVGKPRLPAKTFLVGLPPEAKVIGIELIKKEQENLGCYKIEPFQYLNWDESNIDQLVEESYTKNSFPEYIFKYLGVGKLGKYSYARIGFYPIQYNLENNELLLFKSITLRVEYLTTKHSSNNQLSYQDNDDIAPKMIVNFPSIKSFYAVTSSKIMSNYNDYNFILITTDGNVDALQSFKEWKESIGHCVKIVTTSWIYNNYNGRDEPEKIRNFIKSEYEKYFIKYVLIVGSHDFIPMRFFNTAGLNPDSEYAKSHPDLIVPTDYYYCDLDEDWNKDNDSYFGEVYDDGIENIAFSPEVFVGRIPFDSPSEIQNVCNMIQDFESSNEGWKKKALLLGAILKYKNEGGWDSYRADTAILMDKIKNDIFESSGYETTTMYEKEGIDPSNLDCNYALTCENVLSEWEKGYGLVSWGAHGGGKKIVRRFWANDDGDISETPDWDEIERPTLISNSDYLSLNEGRSSIVFSCSCNNAYPEVIDNLGKTLLKRGSVAFIGATRSVYYPSDWNDVNDGGAMCIDYQFTHNLVKEGQSCGEAIHYSKYFFREKYCHSIYGGGYLDYLNIVAFNLYGDPSIVLESFRPEKPIGPSNGIPENEYMYRTRYTHPEGRQIYFWWDWGDGTNSDWLGPYNSGEYCETIHVWGSRREFNVKVKAKDTYGAETDWSDSLIVTITKGRASKTMNYPFLNNIFNCFSKLDFKYHFPLLQRLLNL